MTNNAINSGFPIDVPSGGTGAASETAYAVLCGGTTSGASIQPVAGLGNSTDVLTSNGAGALPTFQTSPASATTVSVGGISNNWYASGTVWNGTADVIRSQSTVTGTLYFVPFYVSKSTTYIKIGRLIGTTAVGNTVLGLYNSSAGKPTGSPIANSNSGSIANTASTFGSFTFGAAITLAAGMYFCAFSLSGTSTVISAGSLDNYGGRGTGIPNPPAIGNIRQGIGGYSQTFVYSTTLPAVGVLTAVAGYGLGDSYVFLQAQ